MKNIFISIYRKYWAHFLVWSIFIFYEAVVVGLIFGVFGHFMAYLTHYILVIFLFYTASNGLLPWCIGRDKGRAWIMGLSYIILISFFIIFNYLADVWLVQQKFITHVLRIEFDKEYVLRVLYRCIYILGFSTAYYFMINYLKVIRRTAEFEKQKLSQIVKEEQTLAKLKSVENSFLRAQINPHFLFNTLGYIRYHLSKHSKEASDAITLLSDIMRYAIDINSSENLIILSLEISQVQKLFSLQQMRSENLMNIHFDIEHEAAETKFIPFVLLTLAENMVKHGEFSEKQSGGIFSISLFEGSLRIFTRNLIKQSKDFESSGVGLTNVADRLKYAYGNGASLLLFSEDDWFEVEIFLRIDFES